MFERISIEQQRVGGTESTWHMGFLAEAMLFYCRVEVIANFGNVAQLIRAVGPEVLIEFLDRRHLVLHIEPNPPGIDYLVDKIVKGWRPDQFVEGAMRKFLEKPN